MTIKKRLEALEQSCREQGVRLIYDDVTGEGGMCRLRDCWMIIINRRAAAETRVRIIAESLERIGALRSRQASAALTAPVEEAVEGLGVGVRAGPAEPRPDASLDLD